MGTASEPYSSTDAQIFACIEAAKTWDKDAKLEDFQLRIVENDLVLVNLKSGQTYLIDDEDADPLGYSGTIPESQPIPTAGSATESMARSAASIAARAASSLLGLFDPQPTSVSSRRRGLTR